MRFYTNQHKYYCGIDLHSTQMYLCILDQEGKIVLHKNIKTDPDDFLNAIRKFRDDLVVGVECMFCWYWLSDLCAREGIAFALGHALYMKAINGGKAKNDKIDSEKIARLLKGEMLHITYVYPPEMRATRDLMRRRLFFVRKRAELISHIQMTHQQYNLPVPAIRTDRSATFKGVEFNFPDSSVNKTLEFDLHMIAHYNHEISSLESYILKTAQKGPMSSLPLGLLKTFPGIGDVLALTLLYEIQDIKRFPRVQQFASYARLVKPQKTSNGKATGGGGGKIGNAHIKWALSEAAILYIRSSDQGKRYIERLRKKHSRAKALTVLAAKALTVLAHKIGRAVYHILSHRVAFNEEEFVKA